MLAIFSRDIALSFFVLATAINAQSCAGARQVSPPQPEQSQQHSRENAAISLQQARRVEVAADRFIGRFRETLDFGVLFDEMFVADAIQRLRKASFFQNMNLSPQLVERLDDATLKRTYKAFMNYYYLKAVYDLGVGKDESTPPEVAAVIKASKFSNLFSDEGSGDATITTQEELEQFVTDLNDIAASYKNHLAQNVFDFPTYKASLKTLNIEGRRVLRIKNGYEDFGVREGTKVYAVEQDIFIIFFVEENAELKVLM
jgi:hypothetical protein